MAGEQVWAWLKSGKQVPAELVGTVKRGKLKGSPRVLILVLETNSRGDWGFRSKLVTAMSYTTSVKQSRGRIGPQGRWRPLDGVR